MESIADENMSKDTFGGKKQSLVSMHEVGNNQMIRMTASD